MQVRALGDEQWQKLGYKFTAPAGVQMKTDAFISAVRAEASKMRPTEASKYLNAYGLHPQVSTFYALPYVKDIGGLLRFLQTDYMQNIVNCAQIIVGTILTGKNLLDDVDHQFVLMSTQLELAKQRMELYKLPRRNISESIKYGNRVRSSVTAPWGVMAERKSIEKAQRRREELQCSPLESPSETL
jgi:hypothetical protein